MDAPIKRVLDQRLPERTAEHGEAVAANGFSEAREKRLLIGFARRTRQRPNRYVRTLATQRGQPPDRDNRSC
jgi:hypothetical protein